MNPPPLPENEIEELLRNKKRWTRLETSLRKLREAYSVQGQISNLHKAEMILAVESGANLETLIKENYPQYWSEQYEAPTVAQKRGCLGILMLFLLMSFGVIVAGLNQGCSAHHYDAMRAVEEGSEGDLLIVGKTLVAREPEYQTSLDAAGFIFRTRETMKTEAERRGVKIANQDVTTECNPIIEVPHGVNAAVISHCKGLSDFS